MSVTTNSILIDGPAEDVFTYATTPKHWPLYHPNSLGVSGVTDRPVQVGDVTRERASLMGHEGEGEWRVVERVAPHKVVWSIDNPNFKAHLMYMFEAQEGSTHFIRRWHTRYHLKAKRYSSSSSLCTPNQKRPYKISRK
jgi:uncharacterized protein YndB with AHSA1/START domain